MLHPFSPERRQFLSLSAMIGAGLLFPGLLCSCATPGSAARSPLAGWHNWPVERKIAQMLMLGFPGDSLEPDSPPLIAVQDLGIGGVVLFDNNAALGVTDRNITSPAQLKTLTNALQQSAATPLFIAVDQEGGFVARLKDSAGFPSSVSVGALGEKNDPAVTRTHSDALAATLKTYGFNLNLAPVVDLNSNPDNPIIGGKERSFSADPEIVHTHAAEFVASHRRQGIITCLKHFPGHGSSRNDSHLGLVDVTKDWNTAELLPYRTMIEQGLCDIVMTAHTFNTRLDPDYPATLSKTTIDGILRKQLGYNGVVVSDDLNMGAIVQNYTYESAVEKAINAGVDVLIVANNKIYSPDVAPRSIDLLLKLVEDGRITRERIDEACGRIMSLKERYNLG